MIIIFDVDGTLALDDHRRHLLDLPDNSKWDAYHAASVDDPPRPGMFQLLNLLADQGHHVEIWTGRTDDYREQTETWLTEQCVAEGGYELEFDECLKMRRAGDFRSVNVVKGEWLAELRVEYGEPDLVFEDRPGPAEWWRQQGITCALVANNT